MKAFFNHDLIQKLIEILFEKFWIAIIIMFCALFIDKSFHRYKLLEEQRIIGVNQSVGSLREIWSQVDSFEFLTNVIVREHKSYQIMKLFKNINEKDGEKRLKEQEDIIQELFVEKDKKMMRLTELVKKETFVIGEEEAMRAVQCAGLMNQKMEIEIKLLNNNLNDYENKLLRDAENAFGQLIKEMKLDMREAKERMVLRLF